MVRKLLPPQAADSQSSWAESSALQSLRRNPKSTSIEDEDLDAVSPPMAEHEEGSVERIDVELRRTMAPGMSKLLRQCPFLGPYPQSKRWHDSDGWGLFPGLLVRPAEDPAQRGGTHARVEQRGEEEFAPVHFRDIL